MTTFVLLEANHLFLNEEPWRRLERLIDDTWFVNMDPRLAKGIIAKEHAESGVERTWEAVARRPTSVSTVQPAILPAIAVFCLHMQAS